jgi:predicted amidohydrolase
MRKVVVAATQMPATWDIEANLIQAEQTVRAAARAGAQIILLQ